MAKDTIKAVVELIRGFMSYKQERDFKAAQAAEAWEDVYAKRLANIRTAIEIPTSAHVRE